MRLFRPVLSTTTLAVLVACGGGGSVTTPPPPPTDPTWDLAGRGVPQFVTAQYVDLARIQRISRFRSGIGHDYSDGTETCRSMKHYFEPRSGTDWTTVPLSSPVPGTVQALLEESLGTKVSIRSAQYPAFAFQLFHVRLSAPLVVGAAVSAGQVLGTHFSAQTFSDIAVQVNTPQGLRLVSWFETLTDAAWQGYVSRGIASRTAFLITKAERDADPLACSGSSPFSLPGSIPNWVVLG